MRRDTRIGTAGADRGNAASCTGRASRELLGDLGVVGMRAIAPRRRPRRPDRMRDDDALRRPPLGTRRALDEGDDRAQHRVGSVEVALVHAQLARRRSSPSRCGCASVGSARSARARARAGAPAARRRRAARPALEPELELRRIVAPTAKESRQRAKHLAGPDTKPPEAAFQTSVDTSIFSGVMLMLLTDDGRPPRMRLDIVPAVEITVPFFVCSM